MSYAEIASRLLHEHQIGVAFHPLAAGDAVKRPEDAYAVQSLFVDLMKETAGAAVGYKIGLTSARMQAMCRINSPIAGVVLANLVHNSGASLIIGDYGRLGVEFEI